MATSPDNVRAGGATVAIGGTDTELVQALKASQAKLRGFQSAVSAMSLKMIAAGAAMAAPFVLAAKKQMDFEKGLAFVSTMLSEADQEYMPLYREGVDALAREFGESTDTISRGLYDLLSASVPAADALDVLRTVMIAAAAGMTDTAVAADAITTVLNSYRLEASKAGDVSDWFFSVVKRGKTTFAELAPSIGMVASTAAAAGLSLEETGAALATMTRNGVRTRRAVTALRAILTAFLSPTDAAAAAAKRFGFELNTVTLRTEGLAGVFRRLAVLTPEQISEVFPNVRAITGVSPILGDLAGFLKDIALQGQRAGATQEAFGRISITAAYKLGQLRQELASVARDIGKAVMPVLVELGETVLRMTKAFKGWVAENGAVLRGILSLGIKILVAGLALKAFSLVLGAFIGVLALAQGAVLKVGAALTYLAMHPAVFAAITLGLVVAKLVSLQQTAVSVDRTFRSLLVTKDKERAADLAKLQRLEELEAQERLNNEEMAEARDLLGDLTKGYGDLGVSLDTAKQQLTGVASAWDAVTEGMSRARLLDVQRAIREVTVEMQQSADALYAYGGAGKYGWGILETFTGWSEKAARAQKRLNAAARERGRLLQEQRALQQAIAGGEVLPLEVLAGKQAKPSPVVAPPSIEPLTPGGVDEKAIKAARKLEEEIQKARLEAIEDAQKRELALLEHERQLRIQKAAETGESVERIQQLFFHRRAAIEERFYSERLGVRQRLADELEAEELRGGTKGVSQQLALIDLQRRQALRDLRFRERAGGAHPEERWMIKRLFSLRAAATVEAGREFTAVGGFSMAAAQMRLGTQGPIIDVARNTLEANKLLNRIDRNTAELGRFQ